MSTRRSVLRTLGSLGVVGSAGCAALPGVGDAPRPMLERDATPPDVRDGPWRAPRCDARNSGVPGAVGPGNAPGLAWRRSLGDESRITAPPVADAGDVFVHDDASRSLFCLDASDASERWRVEGVTAAPGAPPTVTDDAVYILATGRRVRSFGRDGSETWRSDRLPAMPRAVTVGDGRLYVACASADGESALVALDTAGSVVWTRETGRILAPPAVAEIDGTSGGENSVVVGDDAGTVTCVGAGDGRVRWRDSPVGDWVRAAPVVDGRYAYVGSGTGGFDGGTSSGHRTQSGDFGGGAVTAYDVRTGETRWSRTSDAVSVHSAPANGGGRLFVADSRGTLRRLDAETGEVVWRFSASRPPGPESARGRDYAPAVSNGLVFYAGPDRRLYVVETDAGEGGAHVSARFRADAEATTAPVVAGDSLFVGAENEVVAVGRVDPRP
ncbi:PQQ-binding-like beta-propeller repeat protein [Halopelagius fulvigenes]|uniref:PQQ-binding-like beta-propeller repeat protein n=1 Tax=Halopelagius fulvigenes TaxID=1198324 RepID=A0ABD5TY65_9EURY